MKIAATQYSLSTKSFEVYLSGCNASPKCRGCHNPELWRFDVGREYNKEYFLEIYDKISKFESLIDKISIFGGEPLDQNRDEFVQFVSDMNSFGLEMWLYTRYEIEDVPQWAKDTFHYIKCGEYDEAKLTSNNTQYGIKLATSNQNIYKRNIDY